MSDQESHFRVLYIAMAAMAGSVTALSFLPWKSMSWTEIGMTLFVGSTFAIFGVPWLAHDWAHIDIENLRAICAITYFGATGANVFIPIVIRRFKKALGGEQ